ncbi:MAG TPA: maleylpyruvate isomerase family mycothiol-dependent enzyme [Micromonosporaceae bacterium]|nr:maleylpyruvate isomerase family mycothiol-dependent enzyme [Micromonosporaceae bacterium]
MSMSDTRASAALTGGAALLERAINYTLGSLHVVTPEAMSHPTPCHGWNLRDLLAHLDDSLLALDEAVSIGRVALHGVPEHIDVMTGFAADRPIERALDPAFDPALDPALDPVVSLRRRACRLLGAWAAAQSDQAVSVGGLPLTAGIITGTGAVELAVHGWDVARACGWDRPIPPSLAVELLELCRLLVGEADRPARFAAPIDLPGSAGPGDRLIAFLGRDPGMPRAPAGGVTP